MVYGRHYLKWKGQQLRLATGRLLATIEPDSKWAGMNRVRWPDGELSDMANLTWAKEGAVRGSLANLNRQETGAEASPMRHFSEAAE